MPPPAGATPGQSRRCAPYLPQRCCRGEYRQHTVKQGIKLPPLRGFLSVLVSIKYLMIIDKYFSTFIAMYAII